MINKILRKIKKYINKDNNKTYETKGLLNFDGISCQDYIFQMIKSGNPFMVSRFGSVELDAICYCLNLNIKSDFVRKVHYILDKTYSPKLEEDDYVAKTLTNNGGFFPYDKENLKKFTQIYLNSLKNIDLLGSWLVKEKYVKSYMDENVKYAKLGDLEPYKFNNPWSKALENKKVLIIHPFENSIKFQYNNNRKMIFKDENVLPKFQLITLKSVQSIAGEKTDFNTWFDALDSMKKKIDDIDFDISIIGCGAYGLPLASYIKSIGKQAIHLGGATQILFGIKGKRWEERNDFVVLFNEFWKNPEISEVPKNSHNVENGCYW